MSLTMSDNLRREIRVDARVPISIVRGRRVVPLETADVSFKGLFLRTDEPAAVRSLVRLKVTLPTREIEAHAMVVHVVSPTEAGDRGAGLGLQFWGLAGSDRAAWDEFVGRLIQARKASSPMRPVEAAPESPPASDPGDRATPSGIRVAPFVMPAQLKKPG